MLKEGWFESLEPVDFVRSLAIIIAFLSSGLFASSAQWIRGQAMGGFAFSTFLICFPHTFLEFQVNGELEAIHLHHAQVMGVMMMGMLTVMILNSNSKDDKFWVSAFLCGSLTQGLCLIATVRAQAKYYDTTPGFTAQHLTFMGLAILTQFIGVTRQALIYRGSGRSSTSEGDRRLNTHLLVDMLVTSLGAFIGWGYPEFVAKMELAEGAAVDPILTTQIRILAVADLAFMLLSWAAIRASDDKVKGNVLLCKTVVIVSYMAAAVWGHVSHGITPNINNLAFNLSFCGLAVLNTAAGAYRQHKK